MQNIKLGISACLLGEPVRYDGGHKLDRFLKELLGRFVEYVPVCPEVECGLPTPRESMHLQGDPQNPRLITSRTRIDLTDRMADWSERRVRELEAEDLCGFVFKSNSASSGMERVRVYDENGVPRRSGSGLFARSFMSRLPLIPVEDEGRLHDAAIRENFIERIFVTKHLAGYFKKQLSMDEKQELQELISQYHSGLLPLIVPVTLLNHYARKYGQDYLKSQRYLNPHPVELQLRNHV